MPPPCLHIQPRQELCISDAPELGCIYGLDSLSALTSLSLHACPHAVRRPTDMAPTEQASALAVVLPTLTQLRALKLTGATTLERLPAGVSALTALTSLVVDVRMRDRGPEGAEPEDFAPLGRGGGGDAGLLRCFDLRRLVVRGFDGPLHLPEGMERFSLLEVRRLDGAHATELPGGYPIFPCVLGRPGRHAAAVTTTPFSESFCLQLLFLPCAPSPVRRRPCPCQVALLTCLSIP
jgi:hypothetical protein